MKIYPTAPRLNKKTGKYEIEVSDKSILEFTTREEALEMFFTLQEEKIEKIEADYLFP